MRKIINFLGFCVLSFIFSSHVSAGNVGITGDATVVSNWGSNENEDLWIKINAPVKNPSVCTHSSWYILESSASDISRAMVIGAQLNGSKLSIVIHGNACTSSGYPMIVNVSLPN